MSNISKNTIKLNKYKVEFLDTKVSKVFTSEQWVKDKDLIYFINRYDFHSDVIFSCPVSRIKAITLIK